MPTEPKLQPFQVEFRRQGSEEVVRKEYSLLTPDRTLIFQFPEETTLENMCNMADSFSRLMENLPPVIFVPPGVELKVLTIKGE